MAFRRSSLKRYRGSKERLVFFFPHNGTSAALPPHQSKFLRVGFGEGLFQSALPDIFTSFKTRLHTAAGQRRRSSCRVGEPAGVLLGVGDHRRDVAAADFLAVPLGKLGDAGRDTHIPDRRRMAEMASSAASRLERPSMFSSIMLAILMNLSKWASRLYSSTMGRRMALHSPWGRL